MESKIRKVGNSLGVILPKHLIEELHLKSGDKISIERKGTGLELRPVDSEFEEWAKAYHELNTNYKDVLKALAE
jgi:putative addiction module antidote